MGEPGLLGRRRDVYHVTFWVTRDAAAVLKKEGRGQEREQGAKRPARVDEVGAGGRCARHPRQVDHEARADTGEQRGGLRTRLGEGHDPRDEQRRGRARSPFPLNACPQVTAGPGLAPAAISRAGTPVQVSGGTQA